MSIENQLTELIALQKETLEVLKAQGTAAPAAAPATRTRKATTAPAADPAPAATPEPAKETPAATTPASKGPTANDLKKFVKDERTRLAEVSGEAVKLHKEESAKILKKYGLTDFTSIPEDKVTEILADFKAVNVEQPKDDLADEDDDGL